MGHTIALQAKTTAKTVRDVHNGLESVIVVKKFTQGLEEIRNNLRRELEDRYLYSIDASYARYLETSDPPFGDTDLSKFGGAAGEIAEVHKMPRFAPQQGRRFSPYAGYGRSTSGAWCSQEGHHTHCRWPLADVARDRQQHRRSSHQADGRWAR